MKLLFYYIHNNNIFWWVLLTYDITLFRLLLLYYCSYISVKIQSFVVLSVMYHCMLAVPCFQMVKTYYYSTYVVCTIVLYWLNLMGQNFFRDELSFSLCLYCISFYTYICLNSNIICVCGKLSSTGVWIY